MWDLEARRRGIPLHQLYADGKPTPARIEVGISLGIQADFEVLAAQIEKALDDGYRRVKLKIEPGADVDVVAGVRRRFGDIPLMVDANCAYGRDDLDLLARLDEYGLVMIEQPFEYDELDTHAALQARIETPICLDESAKTKD